MNALRPLAVMLLLMTMLAVSVSAITMEPNPEDVKKCQNVSYLTANADLIVEGHVEKTETKWNTEPHIIYTYQNFIIEKYLKGPKQDGNRLMLKSVGNDCVNDECQFVEEPSGIRLRENRTYQLYLNMSGDIPLTACLYGGVIELKPEQPTVGPSVGDVNQGPPTACASDADCKPGEKCMDGLCGAEPTASPPFPSGPSVGGVGQGAPIPCASDADCAKPGMKCVEKTCQDEPTTGQPSPSGPTAGEPTRQPWTPCTSDADCNGKSCVEGDCILISMPETPPSLPPTSGPAANPSEPTTISTSAGEITTKEQVRVRNAKLYVVISEEEKRITLPPTASGVAILRIELKEENQQPVYVMSGTKPAKLLLFIPVTLNVESTVDAQTGSVLATHKPWWSFLTIE